MTANTHRAERRPQANGQVRPDARQLGLDGMRGMALLAVVCFHTLRIKGQHGAWGSLWAAVQESSWAGVDLFFVLSGFLITGILLDSRDSRRYFINFYARRTLRIFPLYYAVLIVALLIVPAVIGLRRLPELYPRLLGSQIWLWTYTANYLQAGHAHTLPGFGHFWSLAVEEQFYWFWPVVVYFASRRFLLRFCVATCCGLPLLRLALLWHGSTPWALRQYTFTRFDTLLFGAIVAIVVRDPALIARVRAKVPIVSAAALIGLLWIGFRVGFVPFEGAATLVAGYSAFGILFAALVFEVVMHDAPGIEAFLSAKALGWFGKYSYGIYIFHWPVAQAVAALSRYWSSPSLPEALTVGCSAVLVLAISSGIAWISWNALEVHFLYLKRYFDDSRPRVRHLSPVRAQSLVLVPAFHNSKDKDCSNVL